MCRADTFATGTPYVNAVMLILSSPRRHEINQGTRDALVQPSPSHRGPFVQPLWEGAEQRAPTNYS